MSTDFAPINLTHHFLIAMPGMQDDSFARSVVYLCEHSERGALGLIINKPTDLSLKGLLDKVDLSLRRDDLADAPVFLGGPVQSDRGFVLHDPMRSADAPAAIARWLRHMSHATPPSRAMSHARTAASCWQIPCPAWRLRRISPSAQPRRCAR